MEEQSSTTPRVNKALLAKYIGKTVRLVATVTGKRQESIEVQACDGGSVTVRLGNQGDEYTVGGVCEIIGKVHEDLTIEEYNMTPWNPEFNMDNFNQLVFLQLQLYLFHRFSSHKISPKYLDSN
jgi:replication factor A3